MSSSDDFEFYDREQLLKGDVAPSRRADTLLFAIENRSAYLSAESKKSTALYLTAKAAEQSEQAFFEGPIDAYTRVISPQSMLPNRLSAAGCAGFLPAWPARWKPCRRSG